MTIMTIMTKPMMKIGVDDKDENDELWWWLWLWSIVMLVN